MKKREILLVMLLSIGAGSSLVAQNYSTAIGFRGGLSSGATVKHFIDSNKAIEGIVASRWKGLNFIGLYEIDRQISGIDGLSWFYGAGAHIGFWKSVNNFNWFDTSTGNQLVMGIDAIVGVDFTIPNAPINFQLDYKPAYNLIGHQGWWGDEFSISVRFTLK